MKYPNRVLNQRGIRIEEYGKNKNSFKGKRERICRVQGYHSVHAITNAFKRGVIL